MSVPHKHDGLGLRCLHCNSLRLSVIDSRPHAHSVRRLRRCKNCQQTFWTREVWSDWRGTMIDGQDNAAAEGVL
jgi:transcriptional regulator NrdR family protein